MRRGRRSKGGSEAGGGAGDGSRGERGGGRKRERTRAAFSGIRRKEPIEYCCEMEWAESDWRRETDLVNASEGVRETHPILDDTFLTSNRSSKRFSRVIGPDWRMQAIC